MPSLKTYDLFISHAWTYNAEYHRVVEMLDDAPNFSWRNYSVPEHDPLPATALESALQRQVRPVNAVLVLAGMYVAHRDWIQKEIDLATGFGKPIIGIAPRGQQRIPTEVSEAAVTVARWTTDSIVGAVRRFAL